MAKYVDGFLLVVPKGKEEDYRKMAEDGREAWMKHGALQYFECQGDDLIPPDMGEDKNLAFTEMAGATPDENIWFSFIVFESKAHRDEVNQKVMVEMNEKYKDGMDYPMPFDMTKMAYGGFRVVVEG